MVQIRYLLSCFIYFLLFPLMAQIPSQPVRLELPFDMETTEAEVVVMPDSGLLIYHKIGNAWLTNVSFNFTKYNTELKPVWADTLSMPADSDFLRSYAAAPYLYLAFGEDDMRHYTFVRIHQATGQMQHKRYELDQIDALYEFSVLQGNYFIIGHHKKERKPTLLHLDTRTDEVQLLPSVYGEESTFSDLLADQKRNQVDAVITESNGRVSRMQIKRFDAKGRLLNNQFILQQEQRSLLNAEITPGDSAQKMLFGTFGTRDLRYNQGFFSAPLTTSVIDEEGNFYSMLQLKNFFKYLKPRQEERTRRREAARLKQGKNPRYRFRLLLHDLILAPDGYILAAEAYFPQYSQSNNNWGIDRTIALGRRQQEGYKRTHAVALGFNKEGELLWDNIFPLKDLTTFELVHAIEVGLMPDGKVVMAYPDKDKIVYRILDKGKYTPEETELTLLTYEENEKIQDTRFPGVIKWYGNNFAAFGFQRIKPKNEASRMVFYINKITF